jgi:hypothetical protein
MRRHQKEHLIINIPADKAPLRKYENSPKLQSIKLKEFIADLSAKGIDVVGGDGPQIRVSLRNLATRNGSIHEGKRALLAALSQLNADAISLEPEDASYIQGVNVFSHAIGRGLESGSEGLKRLLCDVPISEGDGEGDSIPLLDRLEAANDFVVNDHAPANVDPEKLRNGADKDLLLNTNLLGNVNEDYRNWMEPAPEQEYVMPEDFVAKPRPYKSIFDNGND